MVHLLLARGLPTAPGFHHPKEGKERADGPSISSAVAPHARCGSCGRIAVTTIGDPAGPIAGEIAGLWWLLLVVGAVVYAGVIALFATAFLRRRRHGEPRTAVDPRSSNRWVVGGGVVLPSVVLTGVLVASVDVMRDIPYEGADGGLVVEVTAQQFWWGATYPDAGVTVANELHIPVGVPVEVRLVSTDVIHSFWVPELNGKIDAIPEDTNNLVLLADEPGQYVGRCAEFCGLLHAKMEFLVVAEPRERFEAWLERQAEPAVEPASASARRGRGVFLAAGCGSCHTVDGTPADGDGGPDLTHLASRSTLAATAVPNTTGNLERWLRDPASVKEGVTMPAADVTADELADLVAYLESLE